MLNFLTAVAIGNSFWKWTKEILHYNKNKGIRVSQLAKISTLFSHWSLNQEKGYLFDCIEKKVEDLKDTQCWSILKYLFRKQREKVSLPIKVLSSAISPSIPQTNPVTLTIPPGRHE